MESLQILLNQMGESKVILTYTELPKPIFATYYRDKHISAIGINRSAVITKSFEFEVFKAAVGLHKTLSGADYKIIIDDNNIDMLAPVGEALMKDQGIIIGNRTVLNKPDNIDYIDVVVHKKVNKLLNERDKSDLLKYKTSRQADYNIYDYKKSYSAEYRQYRYNALQKAYEHFKYRILPNSEYRHFRYKVLGITQYELYKYKTIKQILLDNYPGINDLDEKLDERIKYYSSRCEN